MKWQRSLRAVTLAAATFTATLSGGNRHFTMGQDAMAAGPPVTTPAEAEDRFGYDLLTRLTAQKKAENVFISPFSITQAMLLAANGAGGSSRSAILSTLHLSGGLDAVNTHQADIRKQLLDQAKESNGPQIIVANALWADRKFTLAPAYVAACQRYYSAEATTLDFSHAEPAAKQINAWVSKNTKDRIPTIIGAKTLAGPPPAQAVLTNAIYFKARWSHEFWKNSTKPEPFTLPDGTKKQVPLMRQIGAESFSYLQGDGFTAARLGYLGGSAMYVLLPNAGSTPSAVLQKLRTEGFGKWESRWDGNVKMDLFLPRFKTEYSAELVPPLGAMGLTPALGSKADFSPMGLRGAFIGAIIHKTFVSVDEEGTEAAAATAIAMPAGAMMPREKRHVVFRVDRPFVMAVVDGRTHTLLFAGVINDPTR